MSRNSASRRWGFTLAEVLAALALMAIVVPVAMQGVSIANRAGMLGERKAMAARVAARVLNENLVTGELLESSANGSISQGDTTYEWTLQSESWTEDALTLVTVNVTYLVQDQPYDVSMSTLYDANASASLTDSTGASVRF